MHKHVYQQRKLEHFDFVWPLFSLHTLSALSRGRGLVPTTAMDTEALSELSPEAQRQLLKAANERISATTVAFYRKPIHRHRDLMDWTDHVFADVPTFVYFCILYFSAKLVHAGFFRYSATFKNLSNANQRTTVIYVLNIVYTTLALALQLVASPTLAEDYTLLGAHCIKLVGLIISGLYLFELVYREWMRWPMLIHHFATLFAILFVGTAIDETLQPAYLVAGLLWLFQATTEQSVFVGLLLCKLLQPQVMLLTKADVFLTDRLKYPPGLVSKTLKVAAIQST